MNQKIKQIKEQVQEDLLTVLDGHIQEDVKDNVCGIAINSINASVKSISQSLNVFRVSTTAYEEEDFHLLTTLSEKQIVKIISTIVEAERNGGNFYDNETLVGTLQDLYHNDIVIFYQDFETIKI